MVTERGRDSFRWVTAGLLALLTVIALVASVVGIWTQQILFDTDKWLETVEPLATDPVVTGAVADVVSQELIEFLEPSSRLEALLPDRLAPLADRAGDAIENLVVEETNDLLASERFGDIWLEINARAHTAVVAILRDEVPFLSTSEGVVSVDLEPFLVPVLDGVIDRLQGLGEVIPELVLNAVEFDDAISQLISDYEQSEFPAELNEVVIYTSDTLGTLQDLVALFDRLVVVFPIVAFVLGLAAILLAPRRLWMTSALSVLGALGVLGWRFYTDWNIAKAVARFESESASELSLALLTGVTSSLYDVLSLIVILALIAGAGGGLALFLAGRDKESASS